ncbi:MAG: hypothetical protein WC729_13090 [Sphingomonas sp.]|uniref:hypothetical protein n=1 Tax=Sphingomonas sp. TaxID=28214 RepID=UPI0035677C84
MLEQPGFAHGVALIGRATACCQDVVPQCWEVVLQQGVVGKDQTRAGKGKRCVGSKTVIIQLADTARNHRVAKQ